jgi:hypothetical protein
MKRSRRARVIGLAAILVEVAGLWLRGGRIAGNLIVRCRAGHLFTTLWVPGVSVKSLKLGWWMFQRCPVGHHWAFVTPVGPAALTAAQRREAAEHRDLPVP